MNTAGNFTHGTIEVKKDTLMNDIKGVMTDADELLKEVGSATTERFAVARTKVEGKLGEVISRLGDARTAVTDKAKGAAVATSDYVSDNPWKALAVAAAAGVLVGVLVSRR